MRSLITATACVLLGTAGCTLGAAPLPTATATLHFATIDLPRASYCWSSGGHGECADSAGPDLLLKSGVLKPYRTAGGFEARVSFNPMSPHEFQAQMVLTPAGVTPVAPATENGAITIPAVTPGAAGVYVYMVTGTWNEGSVSFFLALDLTPGVA